MRSPVFRPALVGLLVLAAAPAAAQRPGPDSYMGAPERIQESQPYPALMETARRAARGGSLVGSDYDPDAELYRFKFIKNGVVTHVVVDARSGRVIRVVGG